MNGGNNTRDIEQRQPQNQQNKTQSPRRALPNSKNAVLVNSCQVGLSDLDSSTLLINTSVVIQY